MKDKMNRKSITIWFCAGIFCLSLFVALMPISGNARYMGDWFSPKIITTLLLGWGLIITVCAFLCKCKGKRHIH
jgi:hypothetical protein